MVAKLREAEVLMVKGQAMEEVVGQLGVSDARYYTWRKEYEGFQIDQAKRYEELKQENQRLRKVVGDSPLASLWNFNGHASSCNEIKKSPAGRRLPDGRQGFYKISSLINYKSTILNLHSYISSCPQRGLTSTVVSKSIFFFSLRKFL
jgi:putative transposase